MKTLLTLSLFTLGVIAFAGSATAVGFSFASEKDNPNTVAYYENGLHGIIGEAGITHEGEDIVMKSGGSGNFEQWFWGISSTEGLHGEHSVWLDKTGHESCPDDFILVPNAYPEWGTYLTPGADYCVKTNDFNP